MPAQGELRGPKAPAESARRGGGDWDANEDDFAVWVEPEPGRKCNAFKIQGHSFLITEAIPKDLLHVTGIICGNAAPMGSSICTPCHRRRLRSRYRKLSLEHRQRIAAQTGKPLEEIQ